MVKKRVACVIPPFYRLVESKNNRIMPSMHYVAEVLSQRGHEVMYINGDYADESINYADRVSLSANNWLYEERYKNGHSSYNELLKILGEFNPEYVFIGAGDVLIPTVEVGSKQSCLYLAKKIKSIDKKIKCIGFGFLLRSLNADEMKELDAVITGDGEEQAVEIVECEKRGILEQRWTTDLDKLPILTDKYLYYKPQAQDWDYLMSMRGCMNQCTFCLQPSLGRKVICKMSAARFIKEINYRIEHYGTKGFYFLDMIFLPDASERTYQMLDGLIKIKERYPDFHWWAEARCNIPNVWNDEIMEKVKLSGCSHLKFGVEMTNDSMLKSVHKGITYDQIKQSFQMVQSKGIDTTAYVLLGLPGYTDEDYKEMWTRFRDLNAKNYVININVPYPGTVFYQQMKDRMFEQGIRGIEDFTHTSEVMQNFWGISDETLKLYFSLQGEKDDAITRKYKRKIVDREFYRQNGEVKYME